MLHANLAQELFFRLFTLHQGVAPCWDNGFHFPGGLNTTTNIGWVTYILKLIRVLEGRK